MDFILNGQASGSVATLLMQNNFNTDILRPWAGVNGLGQLTGRQYIACNQNGKKVAVPTTNANATLTKQEWVLLDKAVMVAARQRLKVTAAFRNAGLTYTIPNGMGKTVLQTQSVSEAGKAVISMDPARRGEGDRPEYTLDNLPLPIIHSDFTFNAREIAVSRSDGQPGLDTTMAEQSGRRVAEEAEKLFLGLSTFNNYSYGGGTIYGLTNFPYRGTQVLTDPTESGWTPEVLVNEILSMRQTSVNKNNYGPWTIFTSTGWDPYLDRDYSHFKGDNTLRERIAKINGVTSVESADYLTGLQIIMVQMTSNNARLVNGMDITTLQWETNGGLTLNFKVMAMWVPQIRGDFYHNNGLVHGNVP